MKVRELIKSLQRINLDADIVVQSEFNQYEPKLSITSKNNVLSVETCDKVIISCNK